MKANTSSEDVGGCTNEVDEVVFLPAAAEAVMAAVEELSSIPPHSNDRYTVDSSVS